MLWLFSSHLHGYNNWKADSQEYSLQSQINSLYNKAWKNDGSACTKPRLTKNTDICFYAKIYAPKSVDVVNQLAFLSIEAQSGQLTTNVDYINIGATLDCTIAGYGGGAPPCGDKISLAIRDKVIVKNLTINADSNGKSHLVGYFLNAGDITNMTVEGTIGLYSGALNTTTKNHIGGTGTISTLHIKRWDLSITRPASQYNADTDCTHPNAHICTNASTITFDAGAIHINLGQDTDSDVYEFDKLVLNGNSAGGSSTQTKSITINNLVASQGVRIYPRKSSSGKDGFAIEAAVEDSFGASILSGVAVNTMNRNILLKNMLDSVSFHHFYRTNTRQLRNGHTKQRKQNLNNATKVSYGGYGRSSISKSQITNAYLTDNNDGLSYFTRPAVLGAFSIGNVAVLDSLIKPSNASNESSENNASNDAKTKELSQEEKEQIQAKIKESMANWHQVRAFAMPFGSISYASSGTTRATRSAGGAIAGLSRRVGGFGMLSGYVGYEYSHSKTQMRVSNGILSSHNALVGASYISALDIGTKQLIFKLDARGGLNLPNFNAFEGNREYSADVLTYNYGIESRLGMAFYTSKFGYLTTEIGVAYDIMHVKNFEIDKDSFRTGVANELYPKHIWHFPQALASLRYYQGIGVKHRVQFLIGARYNFANQPNISFTNGNLSDSAPIPLPALYINADATYAFALSRVSELSISYAGIYREGGDSHSLSIKYLKYF